MALVALISPADIQGAKQPPLASREEMGLKLGKFGDFWRICSSRAPLPVCSP